MCYDPGTDIGSVSIKMILWLTFHYLSDFDNPKLLSYSRNHYLICFHYYLKVLLSVTGHEYLSTDPAVARADSTVVYLSNIITSYSVFGQHHQVTAPGVARAGYLVRW